MAKSKWVETITHGGTKRVNIPTAVWTGSGERLAANDTVAAAAAWVAAAVGLAGGGADRSPRPRQRSARSASMVRHRRVDSRHDAP